MGILRPYGRQRCKIAGRDGIKVDNLLPFKELLPQPAYYPLLIVHLRRPFSPEQMSSSFEMPRFYSDPYTPPKRFNTNIPSIILYPPPIFLILNNPQSNATIRAFIEKRFSTNCYSLASILAYIYTRIIIFWHHPKSFHYVYRNVTDKLFDTFAINFLDNFEIPRTDIFPQKSIFSPAIVKRHSHTCSSSRSPPIFVPWNAWLQNLCCRKFSGIGRYRGQIYIKL